MFHRAIFAFGNKKFVCWRMPPSRKAQLTSSTMVARGEVLVLSVVKLMSPCLLAAGSALELELGAWSSNQPSHSAKSCDVTLAQGLTPHHLTYPTGLLPSHLNNKTSPPSIRNLSLSSSTNNFHHESIVSSHPCLPLPILPPLTPFSVQDESQVEKEESSSPQAQEKKDEGEKVCFPSHCQQPPTQTDSPARSK